MLRISQDVNIVFSIGPSLELFFERAAAHDHKRNVRKLLPDLHQYTDSLFLPNTTVENSVSFRQTFHLYGFQIGFRIRHEIVFFDYLAIVKSDVRQQVNLVFIQTNVLVNLLIEALTDSVILKNASYYNALCSTALKTAVLTHSQIVTISALITELCAA